MKKILLIPYVQTNNYFSQ